MVPENKCPYKVQFFKKGYPKKNPRKKTKP